MFRLSKNIQRLFIGLLILAFLPSMALALDVRKDQESAIVRSGGTIKGPAFYSGNTVHIDDVVIDGSLFVAAREIRINGVIKGDVFTASQDVVISGTVEGDVHSAAQTISINGQVFGDIMAASEKMSVAREAVIKRDAMMAASQIILGGQIQRQLLAAAEQIIISGTVEDDVRATAERLELQSKANIGGDFKYSSPNKAVIAGDAKIDGKTDWKFIQHKEPKQETYLDQLISVLFGLAGALTFWFLITLWRPGFWLTTAIPLLERPLASLGIGALTLTLTPLVLIILMVTIVGIPAAIITGLTYGVALYIAKIVVAVSAGHWLSHRFGWPMLHKGVWLVLLGLSLLAVITNLPVVGFFFKLMVIIAGLGSLVLAHWKPTRDGMV